MKSIYSLVVTILLFTSSLFSQNSNFEKGYKAGFAKGYCYNQPVTCIEKAPAFAPTPKINESSNNYQDGYNRGFADGLSYRRTETASASKNQREEIKFNEYISQIPSNGISILAYKEKLYSERKVWIENTMNDIHSFLTTKFVNLDAGEAKKWYDSMLDFQNKLGNKWPDLSQNNVFNPLKSFLTNYTTSMLEAYRGIKKENSRIKDEADANTINWSDSSFVSMPREKFSKVRFVETGKALCNIYESHSLKLLDNDIVPDLVNRFPVKRDGMETELFILYFKKYDSYHYFFFNKSDFVKKSANGNETNILTSEYRLGGLGHPIYIRLSDSTGLIYDKGKPVSTNFLGILKHKIIQYDSDRKYVMTVYRETPCWQDKISGKKYFLDMDRIDQVEIFKDDKLITNNME